MSVISRMMQFSACQSCQTCLQLEQFCWNWWMVEWVVTNAIDATGQIASMIFETILAALAWGKSPHSWDDINVSQAVLSCGIYGIWDNSFLMFLHFKNLFKLKRCLAALACGKSPRPWDDTNVSKAVLSCGIYGIWDNSFLKLLYFKNLFKLKRGLAALACGKSPHPWEDTNVSHAVLSCGYCICDKWFLMFLYFRKFVQIEDRSGSSGMQKITPTLGWHECQSAITALWHLWHLISTVPKFQKKKLFNLKIGLAAVSCGESPHALDDTNISQPEWQCRLGN